MLHYMRIEKDGTIKQADSESFNWLHADKPGKENMLKLAERYKLPKDYFFSALDPDEVSHAEEVEQEEIRKPVLVSLLYPYIPEDAEHEGIYENETISMILLPGKLITCCEKTPPFLNDIMNGTFKLVERPINEKCVLVEISWRATREYVFASRKIKENLDAVHKVLRESTKSEHLLRLADLDKSTIYVSTATAENQPILRSLIKAKYMIDDESRKEWIHDVIVENYQALKMTDQSKQMLTQLDTTFSSVIQNNLNETMKTLTSLTILITIPAIIVGMWGMNVALPFAENPLAFIFILAIMVLVVFLTFLWLKHKGFM